MPMVWSMVMAVLPAWAKPVVRPRAVTPGPHGAPSRALPRIANVRRTVSARLLDFGLTRARRRRSAGSGNVARTGQAGGLGPKSNRRGRRGGLALTAAVSRGTRGVAGEGAHPGRCFHGHHQFAAGRRDGEPDRRQITPGSAAGATAPRTTQSQ